MKKRLLILSLTLLLGAIYQSAYGTPLLEEIGYIVGSSSQQYEFTANQTPLLYEATLSDLSPPDLMGFDSLGLTIGTSTTTIATLSGTGIVSFNATFGTDYSANVSGIGGGSQGTGMFGLLIEPAGSPIPEPSTILLFGTGLVGLAAVRRKGK